MSEHGQHDALAALAGRLAELGHRPVGEHPDVLDSLHRRLSGELDALGRVSAAPGD